MSRLRFDVGEGARVVLSRIDNDVVVRVGDTQAVEIVVDGSEELCNVTQDEQVLTIASTVAITLRVPPATALEVQEIYGDLAVRDIMGPCSVQAVHGETSLRSCVGPTELRAVYGDVAAEQLAGPLVVGEVYGDVHLSQVAAEVRLGAVHGDVRADHVHNTIAMGAVSGDVRVHEVEGLVSVEEVTGDFRGTELRGGMNVHQVGGDLAIRSQIAEGCTYHGVAGGDVIARFPEGTSARFVLEAKGTLLAQLDEVEEEGENRIVGTTGDGAATVELSAGRTLSLKLRGHRASSTVFGMPMGEDIAAQVEAQIAESLGAINIDEIAQRELEKAMKRAEREVERAQKRAQRELERSQERLQRAQERAAAAARRAQARVQRRTGDRVGMFGAPTVTFTAKHGAARAKATDEEQLAILRMVQEGKITIEEAEALLKALDR